MNVFAGFWIDGAVRLPEARHADKEGYVITRHKEKGIIDRWEIADVEEVDFWLDTTPRESLTPEELFASIQAIWPSASEIHKHNDTSWYVDKIEHGVAVDWGNLTQYPPPVEPQWIRITRENVGQYLFRECRFRDSDSQDWRNGKVSGWDPQDNCCLVHSDFEEEMPIMNWDIVEVQV